MLEKQLKDKPSKAIRKKLEVTRSALNQILTQKAEASIFYAKHRLFEMGDKPGRLLARLAADRQGPTTISSLKDGQGKCYYETKTLTKIMGNFYKTLYTSEVSANKEEIRKFIGQLNLPSLSEEDRIFYFI